MSFAKEPLTIVLCLDHAFGRAVGLKQPGHRPIVFAAAGPVHEALKAAGVEVVCLGQSDLLGNPSRVAAAMHWTWNKPAANELARLLGSLPPHRNPIDVPDLGPKPCDMETAAQFFAGFVTLLGTNRLSLHYASDYPLG